jgi:hypothetical protein
VAVTQGCLDTADTLQTGKEGLTTTVNRPGPTKTPALFVLFTDTLQTGNPVKTKFHQIPSIDEIPWNSMEFHQPQFHKIQWNSMEFNGIPPWKLHEIPPWKFHGIPWKIQ